MKRIASVFRPVAVLQTGALLAVLALLPSTGCLRSERIEPATSTAPRLSSTLNPFVYYEQGATLFLAVDGRATQYVKEGEIMPLEIGLANLSNKSLTFDRESFILEDDTGESYPVVSHEEFTRLYDRSRIDARLADTFAELMTIRFQNHTYLPWRLFPFSGEVSNVVDTFELGRQTWTMTYLYFPMPESGLHGKQFTLLARAKELPDPFVVRFAVK